jgi:uncharacterized phiE125 gp8 family phage protein
MSSIEPVVSLPEAQAFLRIETGDEEALLAGFVRSATALCESFLGLRLLEQEFEEMLKPSGSWQALSVVPVRAIESVQGFPPNGAATLLPSTAYSIDIDASGTGWLRLLDPSAISRVRVRGLAGMAATPNEVPEAIRHGLLRLVAHLFADRDGPGAEPPAAVTALWRPFRRMRLS